MDNDVEVMMELQSRDREKSKEENAAALEKIEEEVQHHISPRLEEFKDEDIKDLETKHIRLQRTARSFSSVSLWTEESVVKITSLCVLKMPRIIHALMSFLGFERESICEPETNLFSWKKSKQIFSE